jgi:hypothetical protein
MLLAVALPVRRLIARSKKTCKDFASNTSRAPICLVIFYLARLPRLHSRQRCSLRLFPQLLDFWIRSHLPLCRPIRSHLQSCQLIRLDLRNMVKPRTTLQRFETICFTYKVIKRAIWIIKQSSAFNTK